MWKWKNIISMMRFLFTDVSQKMRIIEESIRKDDKLWARKDGELRIVTA
jgi:hypothetical protein